MAEQRSYPQEKWTLWHSEQLRFYGKPWNPNDKKTAPVMFVYVLNGNPRFRLYMNDGGKKAAIPIAFDPIKFDMILESIMSIANNSTADKIIVSVRASFYEGKKLEKPIVTSRVTIGRDNEGVVYISLHPKDKQPAIFNFLPSFWAELLGSDGEKLSLDKASSICARSWATLIRGMMSSYLVANASNPKEEKESFSNNSARDSSFDEDIPF
jgi:hypothetical protein